MVTYHRVSLRLSSLQRRKLLHKKPVRIRVNLSKRQVRMHGRSAKHAPDLGQTSEIFLNGHQLRAFKNRHDKGKGYQLKFNDHQLAHNVKYGKGFSDFMDSAKQGYDYIPDDVKDYAKDKILDLGKALGKKVVDKALDKAWNTNVVKKARGKIGFGIQAPGWRGGSVKKGKGFMDFFGGLEKERMQHAGLSTDGLPF